MIEQSLNPIAIVEFVEIDTTVASKAVNKTTYRLCSYVAANRTELKLNGLTYSYRNVSVSGTTLEPNGKMPSATLTMHTSESGNLRTRLLQGEDLRGSRVTRIIMPIDCVDGGARAGQRATLERRHVYYVNRIGGGKGNVFTFDLNPAPGLEKLGEPAARAVSSTTCNLRYRLWNPSTGAFVYTSTKDGGCPYGQASESANFPNAVAPFGSKYFDANNNSTEVESNDRCSKSITGCLKRFPMLTANDPIPISIIMVTRKK
jgi:phage-related protein